MMDDNHLAAKDSKGRQNVLKLKKGVSGEKKVWLWEQLVKQTLQGDDLDIFPLTGQEVGFLILVEM